MENSFAFAMGQWKIVLFLPWADGKVISYLPGGAKAPLGPPPANGQTRGALPPWTPCYVGLRPPILWANKGLIVDYY